MKRLKQTYLLILGVAACVVLFGIVYFRTGKAPLVAETGTLTVAGTIYPLYDMARNVAGDQAVVELVLPPGASPHLFEFSPRQLQELQNVKAVFAIGHGLDNWATQITNVVKGAQGVGMDQGIKILTFSY